MRRSFVRGSIIATVGCLGAGVVSAQEATLEEVVVTAQKREQGLSEVPISIIALDGEQVERSGVTRVEDLYAIAPSVNFSPAQSSSGAGLRIRGVGSAGFSNLEPSVSTLIDGVVSGPGGAALTDLFDVERIEVLRGPQGTLFGKNASAGAVNLVSRGPTDVFSGYSVLRYADTLEESRFEGAIGGPLTDALRGRIAGYVMEQNKGQVYNPVRDEDENKRKRFGLRARADYALDDTTFDVIVQYEEQDNACCRTSFYGLQPLAYGALTRLYLLPRLAANGVTPGPDNRLSIADGSLNESTETLHTVLTVSHEFGSGHVLRSITGYRDWYELDQIDVDGVDVNIGNGPRQERDLKLLTEEIQLLSPSGNRFQYVLGASFYDQDSGTNALTAGGAGTILGQSSTLSITGIQVKNYAVFADGTFDVTPRWQAFAGVRGLYEEMEISAFRTGNYFAFPPPGTFSAAAETDDTNWVGRAGVRFIPSDSTSYYLSASRGYKGATIEGGNAIFNPATRNKAIIDPETVEAYELGARTRLFDRRLTLNATLFYSDFFDYQASSFDNTINNQILRNAGELSSRGVEIDFAALPWQGMSLSGGVAYVDAEFTSYVGAPCTAVQNATATCPDLDPGPGVIRGQDLSGKPLHNSPEWQYNVRAQQDFMLTAALGAYVRAEYFWRDEVVYGGDLNPDTTQKAFGLANFRAGMIFGGGKYEATAFVENAFDESYALRIYDSPGFTGSYSGFYGAERTYGVELRTKF
jgi:iron complex outermembrane receptor protein